MGPRIDQVKIKSEILGDVEVRTLETMPASSHDRLVPPLPVEEFAVLWYVRVSTIGRRGWAGRPEPGLADAHVGISG